ncbi:MAG TPA: hypothetical protein VGE35_04600 [Candidatus Paceibacterota bacterium]
MTPDEHRLLIETREMAEENNRILKGLQRTNRASLAFKIVYWVVVLGVLSGALYFLQPYIDTVKSSLSIQ